MRYLIVNILFLFFLVGNSYGQRTILDRRHLGIVNENGAVRLSAELSHSDKLKKISDNLNQINLNLTALTNVQQIIYRSLTEVNGALKNGLMLKQISSTVNDIFRESDQIFSIASGSPEYMLFAEEVTRQLKDRCLSLSGDVTGFILKEGAGILMDFEKRDFLLRKVSLDLQVIRSQLFSISHSIYWAKNYGLVRSLNPYRNFINQDENLASSILQQYDLLRR